MLVARMRVKSWLDGSPRRSAFIPSFLPGTVGGVYAGSICTAATLRDKDDYVNAGIGGALAGSIFGLKC